jgi:hypothetical protein
MSDKPNAAGPAPADLLETLRGLLDPLGQAIVNGVGIVDRDVEQRMHEQATLASAQYALEHMVQAAPLRQRSYRGNGHFELIERVLALAPEDGFHAEFGVFKGESLGFISSRIDKVIYGFDSFEGLPDGWSAALPKGAFDLGGEAPPMPAPLHNYRLVKGWFRDTLPIFLAQAPGPAAFLHLDCYTYASTREVLEALAERIASGTIVVLRQYFNFPGWQVQQHRAFQEFIAETGRRYRYLAFTPAGNSVALVIE